MSDLRLGYVGVGAMGLPMALNLRQAGFPVAFVTGRQAAADELTAAGAMSNEVRCVGGSVIFTAVPSGTGPFTYAWRKATNYIVGATNITLELVNLATTDAGVYTVEISGACNTASASATLNVSTQPNATALTNQTRCTTENVTFSTTVSTAE